MWFVKIKQGFGKKFPGLTSEKILEEMDEIIKEKPDSIHHSRRNQ